MSKIVYPELSYKVQGAFFDVYNALHGFELSEEGWESALLIALADRGLSAERQVEYALRYKGYRIGRFFIDVLVEDKLLLELKVAEALLPIHKAQVITYLKVTGLELGILVNFGGLKLEYRRMPNYISARLADQTPPPTQQDEALLHAELTGSLRAILYAVHRELGPGFMHMHYRRAVQIELRRGDLDYSVKKEVQIAYRGQLIETRETRLLVVENAVLLAPVAVRSITPKHKQRFRQYLKLFDLELGLIANFHSTSLEIETIRLRPPI
jgi:GxxExxY protein